MCDKQNKKMKILEKKVEQLEKKNIPAEQPEKPWKKGNE
jgi:exonuclease VII small subunit